VEYFRESGNRIQAGFALHAGRLLTQYCTLTPALPSDEKYEATLTVCVLQSLLTNCTELLAAMRESQKTFFRTAITDAPHPWGLMRSFVTQNTFPGDATLEGVLEHMRNALSHPTVVEGAELAATGYTTSNDASGLVSAFQFTDSPWVSKGKVFWQALSKSEEKVRDCMEDFERRHKMPTGVLEVRPQLDAKFGIVQDGERYLPVFVIEVPLGALIDLAKCLANYLAQPTNEQWDGHSIHELVA
jgi:hypothetical protein